MAAQLSRRSWRSNEEDDSNFVMKPELVGYYSIDWDNSYLPDSSKMMYYNVNDGAPVRFPLDCKSREIFLDLNRGMESMNRQPYSPERGKLLFKWIKLNYAKIKAPADSDRWIQPDFVCARGLLSKVLCTPYSPKDSWVIRAAKWKGTIYLTFFNNSGYRIPYEDSKKLSYWTFKFDRYMVSDSPNTIPTPDRPIVEVEEFRGVYKLNIGSQTVLFDATVTGVISETPLKDPLPLKDLKFIQLRTSRIVTEPKQENSFRKFKLLRWWSQDVITNTEECVCGFRDDDGIVHRLTSYSLGEIVKMGNSNWNPATCIDFCEDFLQKISETVVNDCSETIYNFERKKEEERIHITTMLPSSSYTVIPPSFLDETR